VSDEPHPGKILNKMNIYMSKRYKVLQAVTVEELENKVNVMMDYGWSIEGSMQAIAVNDVTGFSQTMVREVETIKVENNSDNGKQLLHG
jgi:hypothetical protein